MYQTIKMINTVIVVVLTLAYAYQFAYTLVGIIKRKAAKTPEAANFGRYAALICARNEENVIGELVESLKLQRYPSDKLDVYVLCDNCTDNTAEAARAAGANVLERTDDKLVGKGYALEYLLKRVRANGVPYDGYFIFDADNIVDKNFVYEMNKTIRTGYEAVTCYRNSKNFGANWISSGYSIWFLREARFLNYPRMLFKTSCAISGTGFYVSEKLIGSMGGWPYHLLTEDIQFSVECAIKGEKIGYCDKAMVYDEQPTKFSQSWNQRLRWSKGFYQIDFAYLPALIKGAISNKKGKLACYDMLMTVAPAMLLTLAVLVINAVALSVVFTQPGYIAYRIMRLCMEYLGLALINYYLGMVFYGILTVTSEWKNINASALSKIGYTFTFPLFMATYVPISLAALVTRVEWKPIRHNACKVAVKERIA